MARAKKTAVTKSASPSTAPKTRGIDLQEVEARVTALDKAKRRSYDIFDIEQRVYNLEKNGGGGSANLTTLNATPTTSEQTITPEAPYDGYNEVNISAVTSSIDANIAAGNIKKDVAILGVTGTYEGVSANLTTLNATPTTSAQTITPESPYDGYDEVNIAAVTSAIDANIAAGNIKKDVTILGVTGTYEGGGGGDTDMIVRYSGQATSGTHTITKTGKYVIWTVLAGNYVGDYRFTINNDSATNTIRSGIISQTDLSAGVGYTYSEIDLTAGDVFGWNVTNANRCFIMFSK